MGRTLALGFLVLLSPLAALAREEDPGLGPVEWPTTVEATVADVVESLAEEDKATLRKTPKQDLIVFHHGWGMASATTTACGAATTSCAKQPAARAAIRTKPRW